MKKEIKYLGIFAILVILLCVQQCRVSNLKTDLAMKDNNIKALNDTISETKNKLGQVQYEKSVLISSKSGLEDLNKDLAKEVKAQKGKVAYLQSVVASLSTPKPGPDTSEVETDNQKNPCDTTVNYTIPWNFSQTFDKDNFRKLKGKSQFAISKGVIGSAKSEIEEDEISFNIVTGLEKKDDHYEIFIRSNYPGFKPSKIDGAFIPQKDLFPPQKKLKWSVGPTLNIGLGATLGTNPIVAPYVGVGIGIHYGWIRF